MATKQANYVDGFVIPIPKKNTGAYKKMASEGSKVWRRFGALDYKECMLDQAKPKGVGHTFLKMAKAKAGETVWFSYITYKSKTHRNQVNKKVMAYFSKKYSQTSPMPFDMKRMAYGGFKVIVSS